MLPPIVLNMAMIFHWGGDRHGQVADVPEQLLTSGLLVYDGTDGWIGVYERLGPHRMQDTDRGPAEVWVIRE
jgi:hypothetical protein